MYLTDEELDEIARQYNPRPLSDKALDRVQSDLAALDNALELRKRDALNIIFGVALGVIVGIILGAKLFH